MNQPQSTIITQKYRETSNSIASKFLPTDFCPHPSLTNRHIQTISGVYLRSKDETKYVPDSTTFGLVQSGVKSAWSSLFSSSLTLNPDRIGFYDERQRFETPDQDFFDVDFKYQDDSTTQSRPSSKGMVILLHGLQSNSQSTLSVDMATAYLNEGFDVCCMNFRGCSGEMNRRMGGYHLGFTDDLKQFLQHLKEQRYSDDEVSPPPIFLSGFSLGSNVVLKALGELGDCAHRDFHVYGAAVCGAPFDQERSVDFLQAPGFNSLVYMGSLLKSLKARSLEQMTLFEGTEEWKKIDYNKVVNADTIADIEDAVIAPVYGFRDHIDYYRKNSCGQFLDDITVPTLIINAADDPFFDPSVFPWEKSSDYDANSPIKMVRTAHGGHLGFMFHQQGADGSDEAGDVSIRTEERASWMPSELARFLDCTYQSRTELDDITCALGEIDGVPSLR